MGSNEAFLANQHRALQKMQPGVLGKGVKRPVDRRDTGSRISISGHQNLAHLLVAALCLHFFTHRITLIDLRSRSSAAR